MSRDILDGIYKSGVVSIIRGIDENRVLDTVNALYDGGIRAVEITFDTPGAVKMIDAVARNYGEKMLVGAGTVLDTETARLAIISGADFVLSPTLNIKVIELCSRYSKLAVPGVLTPSEILTAWEAGAQLVKVFPARAFGPAYIKDVKGPLSQVQIMAVGGVSLDNIEEFIQNGAMSLGIGSELVNKAVVAQGNFKKITDSAVSFVEKVSAARAKLEGRMR